MSMNLYSVNLGGSGGGGSTSPGGADTSVQFNNGGSFGGFGSWDGTRFLLPGLLYLQETGGTGTVRLKAADFAADYTITFPDQAPASDTYLHHVAAGLYEWAAISGGAVAWGDITGTLADQTDLATALAAKAPLDSPAFTTSARFSYATATTVPYLDANKDLISSAVTPTELGLLSGKTSLMSGSGTVVDLDNPVYNGTTGAALKKLTGYAVSTAYGANNTYLAVGAGYGVKIAGVDIWEIASSGAMYVSKSSGANILWATDGAGDIGAVAGTRPNNLYVKTNARVGGNLGVGNSASASTLGTVVKKIEIFNASGTSLGFLPVYDAIT